MCHVLALDRETGKVVWDTTVFRQTTGHKNDRNSYATPTSCTDGKGVYAVFGDGSFVALDFSGQVKWVNRDFPFYGEHGLGTSPILWKDLLIMARDGSHPPPDTGAGWHTPWDQACLLALDTDTGRVRWKAQRGLSRIAHVVPAIWDSPPGPAQVISGAGDVVQAFDARTGQRLWSSVNIGEGVVPWLWLMASCSFEPSAAYSAWNRAFPRSKSDRYVLLDFAAGSQLRGSASFIEVLAVQAGDSLSIGTNGTAILKCCAGWCSFWNTSSTK